MGGVRTTGDMVMRVMLSKKMKLPAAKKYVADKLGITLEEMHDSTFMLEYRRDNGLGVIMPYAGDIYGMEAKCRIADKLGIKINSVERFMKNARIK
jgi:dimethylamine--corrinoid protein Co-methyltransferase